MFQVLAQNSIPVLPRPALISRFLLEEPLTLSAALIVAGIVAYFLLQARGQFRRALGAGAAGLCLAAVVQVVAYAIETDREKIIAATTPLVKATAAADTARLDLLLDSGVRLTNERSLAAGELPHGDAWDKARILSEVRDQLGSRWRLKECAILEVQGVIDTPGRGRTQVRVRAIPDVWEVPIITWWRIDWKESPDGAWLVTGIEPVDLGLGSRLR